MFRVWARNDTWDTTAFLYSRSEVTYLHCRKRVQNILIFYYKSVPGISKGDCYFHCTVLSLFNVCLNHKVAPNDHVGVTSNAVTTYLFVFILI